MMAEDNKEYEDPSFNIDDTQSVAIAEKEIVEKERKSKSKWQHFKAEMHRIFSIRDDVASHDEIRSRIISGGELSGFNILIMFCAVVIASIGLYKNSPAVIIGAMLISPLMGRIYLTSYGVASSDRHLFMTGLLGFIIQFLVSFITSTLLFLIVRAVVGVGEPTEELLGRTSPEILDVLVAFVGGIAGLVAQTRKSEFNNVIPGVAIATALMPPICTMGYSLAMGKWTMLLGAFYLFALNSYFIFLGGVIMLALLEVPKVSSLTLRQWRHKRTAMIILTVIMLLPAIVFTVILVLQGRKASAEGSESAYIGFWKTVFRLN